jgi:hypothetical protein
MWISGIRAAHQIGHSGKGYMGLEGQRFPPGLHGNSSAAFAANASTTDMFL